MRKTKHNNLLPALERLVTRYPGSLLTVDSAVIQRFRSDDSYRPSKPVISKLLVWVKENHAFEKSVDRLDRNSCYEFRVNSKGIVQLSHSGVAIGRYCDLKSFKAAFDRSASADELADDCLKALTMCNAVAKGKGVLIEYLIYRVALRRTLKGFRALLSRPDLTPGMLKRIVRMLLPIDPYLILARSFRNETERWTIPQLPEAFNLRFAKAKSKEFNSERYLDFFGRFRSNPHAYDRQETVFALRRLTNVLVKDCSKHPREEQSKMLRKLRHEVDLSLQERSATAGNGKLKDIKNPLGKLLVSESFFYLNMDGLYRSADQAWAELHATQILCSLNYYERVSGCLPKNLHELQQYAAFKNISELHPFIPGRLIYSRKLRLLRATKNLSAEKWTVAGIRN